MELLLVWIVVAHAALVIALTKCMQLLNWFWTTSLRWIASWTLEDAYSHLRVVLDLAEILLPRIKLRLLLLVKDALAILVLGRIDFTIYLILRWLPITCCLFHSVAEIIDVDINGFIQIELIILMQLHVFLLESFHFVTSAVIQMLVVL